MSVIQWASFESNGMGGFSSGLPESHEVLTV